MLTLHHALRVIGRVVALTGVLIITIVVMIVTTLLPTRARRAHAAHFGARMCAQLVLRALGVRVQVHGHPSTASGLLVANHLSWLDIVSALAVWRCTFVAKREVRAWPIVGRFAESLGVVWIDRSRLRDVARVLPLVEQTLRGGTSVLLFPEGTTTDGRVVLPFRSALFQAARAAAVRVVPLAFSTSATHGDASAMNWIGHESLIANVPRVAALQGACVHVSVESAFTHSIDRKSLARTSRDAIVTSLNRPLRPSAAPIRRRRAVTRDPVSA